METSHLVEVGTRIKFRTVDGKIFADVIDSEAVETKPQHEYVVGTWFSFEQANGAFKSVMHPPIMAC